MNSSVLPSVSANLNKLGLGGGGGERAMQSVLRVAAAFQLQLACNVSSHAWGPLQRLS